MSKKCEVTGKRPRFGKSVSHSHRRTSRRFDPNLQKKSYYVPSLGKKITLRLSTKAIKTIDRRGIEAVVQEMIKEGKRF